MLQKINSLQKKILILFFLVWGGKAFASNFSLLFTADSGVLNGKINEYVFYNTYNTKESQLDWDLAGIPYFKAKSEVFLFNYLYLALGGKIGIPVKTGYMQDYDWLNTSDLTELTNYSKHTNYLDFYYEYSARIGASLPINLKKLKMAFTPFAEYTFEGIKFTAKGGYYSYKSNNFKNIYYDDNLEIISYMNLYDSVFFGLKFQADIKPYIFIVAEAAVSPSFTKLCAIDCHFQRNLMFFDDIRNSYQYKAELSVYYKINQKHQVGLLGFINYMPLSYGTDYFTSGVSSTTIYDKSWSLDSSCYSGAQKFTYTIAFTYCFIFN